MSTFVYIRCPSNQTKQAKKTWYRSVLNYIPEEGFRDCPTIKITPDQWPIVCRRLKSWKRQQNTGVKEPIRNEGFYCHGDLRP